MNGAKVGVLKEGDKVRLDRLLESADGRGLEAQVGLEVLSDLTNLLINALVYCSLVASRGSRVDKHIKWAFATVTFNTTQGSDNGNDANEIIEIGLVTSLSCRVQIVAS